MPLISMRDMLASALKDNYAVGYFEAWDQYSLEAVLETAEEVRSPVILGFGGSMMNQDWFDNGGLQSLAALGREATKKAKIPVSLILNEVKTFEQVIQGLALGFNAVMLDTSNLPIKENITITRKVVEASHVLGTDVEGERWELPGFSEITGRPAEIQDPTQDARYVMETGIDALSVSIGNVHLLTEGEAKINFDLLAQLKQLVKIPLVIHGGTGFPDEAVPKVIELGVAKFNVGTILKQIFWNTIRETVSILPSTTNVQEVIGSRKTEDILVRAKNLAKTEIKRRMTVYGSAGKA